MYLLFIVLFYLCIIHVRLIDIQNLHSKLFVEIRLMYRSFRFIILFYPIMFLVQFI